MLFCVVNNDVPYPKMYPKCALGPVAVLLAPTNGSVMLVTLLQPLKAESPIPVIVLLTIIVLMEDNI